MNFCGKCGAVTIIDPTTGHRYCEREKCDWISAEPDPDALREQYVGRLPHGAEVTVFVWWGGEAAICFRAPGSQHWGPRTTLVKEGMPH